MHGDEDSGPIERLKQRLDDAIDDAIAQGYDTFVCGMADGFDMFAGEAIAERIRQGADITLVAAIPFAGHGGREGTPRHARYKRVLDHASESKVLSPHYSEYSYLARNRYMVDRSSLLICCFDGQTGGTAQTVYYAAQRGLRIVNLWVREDD